MRRDVDAQPAAGSVDDDAPARRYLENASIPDLERVVSAVPVWVAASAPVMAVDREVHARKRKDGVLTTGFAVPCLYAARRHLDRRGGDWYVTHSRGADMFRLRMYVVTDTEQVQAPVPGVPGGGPGRARADHRR
jgi:hypothetical protein